MSKIIAAIIILFAATLPASGNQDHEWTSKSGRSVRAQFLRFSEANQAVTLLVIRSLTLDQLDEQSANLARRLKQLRSDDPDGEETRKRRTYPWSDVSGNILHARFYDLTDANSLKILTMATVPLEQLDPRSANLARRLAAEGEPDAASAPGTTTSEASGKSSGGGFWASLFGSNGQSEKRQTEHRSKVRNVDGLILLNDTITAERASTYAKITGIVENRRSQKLSYAEINFNLYDSSGNQVGTAFANITGLERGGRWRFEATGFASKVDSYKFESLTGR